MLHGDIAVFKSCRVNEALQLSEPEFIHRAFWDQFYIWLFCIFFCIILYSVFNEYIGFRCETQQNGD